MNNKIIFTNTVYYDVEEDKFFSVDWEPKGKIMSDMPIVAVKGEEYKYIPEENKYFIVDPRKSSNSENSFTQSDLNEIGDINYIEK